MASGKIFGQSWKEKIAIVNFFIFFI